MSGGFDITITGTKLPNDFVAAEFENLDDSVNYPVTIVSQTYTQVVVNAPVASSGGYVCLSEPLPTALVVHCSCVLFCVSGVFVLL